MRRIGRQLAIDSGKRCGCGDNDGWHNEPGLADAKRVAAEKAEPIGQKGAQNAVVDLAGHTGRMVDEQRIGRYQPETGEY